MNLDLGPWVEILKYGRSEHFVSLEGHLPPDLLNKLRRENTIHVGGDFPRHELSKRVADLERRWGLV